LIFKLLLWVCVCLFVCLLACLFLSLSSSSSRISSTQSLSHTSRKTHLSCLLYFAPNPVLT
jgi:bacteriorhodopsin